MSVAENVQPPPAVARPSPAAVLELLKPITWFPPMWAFACGVISSGAVLGERWPMLLAGVVLAGPLVCAMSQAVNDWYDRHVDAINEPGRPIPSGRIPGAWGFYIALGWTAASLLTGAMLGGVVFAATCVGVVLAWAYSAPPIRLKRSGLWGPAAVGLSYEGLAWFTGAAVMLGAWPPGVIIALALLYSAGAHGVMTLNDFKAIEGDRRTGLRSLPAVMGPRRAAEVACLAMAAPQVVVIALLLSLERPWHAAIVAALLIAQAVLMARFLARPVDRALWYSAIGVPLFVSGMMVSAFAVRPLVGGL